MKSMNVYKVIISIFVAVLILVPVVIVILQTNSKTANAYSSTKPSNAKCVEDYGKGYVLSGYYCVNPIKELLTCNVYNCENYTVKTQSVSKNPPSCSYPCETEIAPGYYLQDLGCDSGYEYNSTTGECDSIILYPGQTCNYLGSTGCSRSDYFFDQNNIFKNSQEYNDNYQVPPGDYLCENCGSSKKEEYSLPTGDYLLETSYENEDANFGISYFDF